MRIFHGDRESGGKFQKETGKKEFGYDCGKQSERRRSRISGDTNVVTLITPEDELHLPLLSKEETAVKILDAIMKQS